MESFDALRPQVFGLLELTCFVAAMLRRKQPHRSCDLSHAAWELEQAFLRQQWAHLCRPDLVAPLPVLGEAIDRCHTLLREPLGPVKPSGTAPPSP